LWGVWGKKRSERAAVTSERSSPDGATVLRCFYPTQQVIQEAIVSDNLRATVAAIEERHLDILLLERHVIELFEMFRDLATLVDLQQESMDVISRHIDKAKNHVERGEVDLQAAEKYQKKSRNLQCCCLFLVLAVLVAVLVPTLLLTVGNA
jgi:t-SNARE complex subunit (syntaxin)